VLLTTIGLARRVERAEIDFCARAADHEAGGRAAILDAGGGRAVFGRTGSPLNKVLGLGLDGAVADADLEAIERFYAGRRASIAIELCPLAGGELSARLCARGYVPRSFENELARTLPAAGDHSAHPWGLVVARTDDDDRWLATVSEGFAVAEGEDGVASIETIAEMSVVMRGFLHPGIQRYMAVDDSGPAGAGASYTVDGVVGIFGTTTRPASRRRGVQQAIVRRIMDDAVPGASLAIATTLPGSSSQRTFERLGFQVLYTRTIFVKDA
jgi:hypothetical protein